MKKLFNTNFNYGGMNFMLLVLRIAISVFILTHGYPKLQSLTAAGEIQFGDPIGIGAPASLALAVFAEVFCSILVLLGFATRLAVIPLIVTMCIAIFIVHAADPFKIKELACHYLVVYLLLLVAGSGKYSVDHLISGGQHKRRR